MPRRIADFGLWVVASLGLVSLVAAAAAVIFGLVPLVFTSGSMGPEIPAGSLGVARSVSVGDVAVGDVVSVGRADGARVTHRVVSVETLGSGKAELTLKGDANERPDKERYQVTEVDRVVFSIPWVGRLVTWLSSPMVVFLGGMLAAGVIMWLIFHRRGAGNDGDGPRQSNGKSKHKAANRMSRRVVAGGVVMAVSGLLVGPQAQPTMAAFSDLGGTVTTSGFVAHRVAQPTSVTCATNLLSVTVTTPVQDPRYTYWARAFKADGTPISDYKQMTGAGSTRSRTFALTDFALSIDIGTTYYIRVFARVGNTSWESLQFKSQPFSRTLVLMSCGTAPQVPAITFKQPLDGSTHKSREILGVVGPACDHNYGSTYAAACGNVSDNGSVANVEYVLQRTGGTLGTRCWNGTIWWFGCNYRPASRNGNAWSVPKGATNAVYNFDGTFTLSIRATDNDGYVTESSITFTVTY